MLLSTLLPHIKSSFVAHRTFPKHMFPHNKVPERCCYSAESSLKQTLPVLVNILPTQPQLVRSFQLTPHSNDPPLNTVLILSMHLCYCKHSFNVLKNSLSLSTAPIHLSLLQADSLL